MISSLIVLNVVLILLAAVPVAYWFYGLADRTWGVVSYVFAVALMLGLSMGIWIVYILGHFLGKVW